MTTVKQFTKEEFLKLSDLDKVKHTIELSIEEHKDFKTAYWEGSAFMGKCVLETIEIIKNL